MPSNEVAGVVEEIGIEEEEGCGDSAKDDIAEDVDDERYLARSKMES